MSSRADKAWNPGLQGPKARSHNDKSRVACEWDPNRHLWHSAGSRPALPTSRALKYPATDSWPVLIRLARTNGASACQETYCRERGTVAVGFWVLHTVRCFSIRYLSGGIKTTIRYLSGMRTLIYAFIYPVSIRYLSGIYPACGWRACCHGSALATIGNTTRPNTCKKIRGIRRQQLASWHCYTHGELTRALRFPHAHGSMILVHCLSSRICNNRNIGRACCS